MRAVNAVSNDSGVEVCNCLDRYVTDWSTVIIWAHCHNKICKDCSSVSFASDSSHICTIGPGPGALAAAGEGKLPLNHKLNTQSSCCEAKAPSTVSHG